MKYYRLQDDIDYPNRWYLGDVLGVDNWELSHSISEVGRVLSVELYQSGNEMDYTYTEVYGLPVVSDKVRMGFSDCAGLKFVPVVIDEVFNDVKYYVMVILDNVECVDEDKSEFQKFMHDDPVRPDKAGEYRAFMTLKLNPEKISNKDVFRLKKFESAIIVSEKVKEKLEAGDATGMEFISV